MTDDIAKEANRRFIERVQAMIDADPELSVASVAEKAGMREGALRHILSGRTQSPKLETAMAISHALGSNLLAMMEFPPDPQVHRLLTHFTRLPDRARATLLMGFETSELSSDEEDNEGEPSPADIQPSE